MRKALIVTVALAFLASAMVVVAQQQIPDTIVIDAAAKKKAPVTFPHAVHTEKVESCTTCHHTQEGLTAENAANVKKCSVCHLDPEEESTPSMRQMSTKKNPLHMGCINCHKEQKAGPTKCNDCHVKAE